MPPTQIYVWGETGYLHFHCNGTLLIWPPMGQKKSGPINRLTVLKGFFKREKD